MSKLTHLDPSGHAQMVDVGNKPETQRVATAAGRILMHPSTLAMILQGNATKGDVLGVARIAAIQAAKRTAELIQIGRASCRERGEARTGDSGVAEREAR